SRTSAITTAAGPNGGTWSESPSRSRPGIGDRENRHLPEKLQKVIDMFQMFDPADRTDMLLSYADQFKEVPPEIAARPFDTSHQVPQCESDAYVWAQKLPDGTMKYYFAVENPSGISANALAA